MRERNRRPEGAGHARGVQRSQTARDDSPSPASVVALLVAVAALAWVLGTTRLEPARSPDLGGTQAVALD